MKAEEREDWMLIARILVFLGGMALVVWLFIAGLLWLGIGGLR